MQIFEFYFNPKAQKDRFFEVFSLEPRLRLAFGKSTAGRQAEKNSAHGNLYMVGELAHALPQNSGLLQKFAKAVSCEYSSFSGAMSQDAFFRALLKKANGFFVQELHRENVDWLGNLHVVLLLVKNSGKKSSLMFSKTGGAKVFMTRGTNVVDLGKNLQDAAHGAGLFSNVVSLHAFAQDKIVILTKDIYDALTKEHALSDLSELSHAKHFEAFLKKREKMFSRLSGIVFAVLMEEFVPQTPPFAFLKRSILSLTFPKFQIPSLHFMLDDALKQKAITIAVFFALLAGGFFVFQGEKKELHRRAQTIVLQIQVIQKEAESALELNDARSANILLQEAWKKASSRTGREVPFRETFIAFKAELEQQLLSINNIQYVEDPEELVDIQNEAANLIPQNMVLAQGNLYLFNPFSSRIFLFDPEKKKGKIISTPKAIRYGIPFAGAALFFQEPHTLLRMDSDGRIETFALKGPPSFARIAAFGQNLYVLNSQQGAIAKYEDPLNNFNVPSPWISEESLKKPASAKSMAIDGNIWILTRDNALERYFGGFWQENIQPLVFPLLKNATMVKSFPGLPYLYVLDPSESRIILLTGSGDLVKQYRIGVQEPLLDFTVSSNGNTLYLLAGSRVFSVKQEEVPHN